MQECLTANLPEVDTKRITDALEFKFESKADFINFNKIMLAKEIMVCSTCI